MSIELSGEIENKIEEAVRSGLFATPGELVETAVRKLLDEKTPAAGRFRTLRERIVESRVPMLSDDELAAEIRRRRGTWA